MTFFFCAFVLSIFVISCWIQVPVLVGKGNFTLVSQQITRYCNFKKKAAAAAIYSDYSVHAN